MKKYYKVVFVVLVYRNIRDLKEFFENQGLTNTKTIVVESYYDENCTREVKYIAEKYNADFISVPNKGYGAGNNAGCKRAIEQYDFDFLVISNADVIIQSFDTRILDKYSNFIIAPKIINLKGKNQNPSSPFRPSRISERFALWIYQGNHTKLIWIYFAISRLKKIIFYYTKFINRIIFSAHGSFVIIPKNILLQLYPIYNEDMFLFNEEEHLGKLAASKGFETIYVPDLKILHKEDGSMKIASVNEFERLKQSFIVYYNYWSR